MSCRVPCSDSGTGVTFPPGFFFLPQRSGLLVGCNVSFCGECFSLKCWRERERLSSRRGWNPHQVFGTGKGGVIFEEEVLGVRNRIMLSGSSRPSTFIDDILVSGAAVQRCSTLHGRSKAGEFWRRRRQERLTPP